MGLAVPQYNFIHKNRPGAVLGMRDEVCWIPELNSCLFMFLLSLSREFGSETFKWDLPVPFLIIFILKHINTLMTRSLCTHVVFIIF